MSVTWSNDEIFKFLELFHAEPSIWDPNNVLHKDRNKVNDAWNRIADTMHIPISELKKKKESLMTVFRAHHKKKQASIRSGAGNDDVYKPIWLFYDIMEGFLAKVYECKSILTTEEGRISPLERPSAIEDFSEQIPTNVEGQKGSEEKQKEVKIPVKKRRAFHPPELEKAEKEMATAFRTLNESLLTNKNQKTEDDCELYGRLLANKLRKFPENERSDIMYELDGLLFRRRHRSSIHSVSSASQIILRKRPSSSPTSNNMINRPSSSNSTYSSENVTQVPSPNTYCESSPNQSPSSNPSPFCNPVHIPGQFQYHQVPSTQTVNVNSTNLKQSDVTQIPSTQTFFNSLPDPSQNLSSHFHIPDHSQDTEVNNPDQEGVQILSTHARYSESPSILTDTFFKSFGSSSKLPKSF